MIIIDEESAGAAWLASLATFVTAEYALLDSGAIGGAYFEAANVVMRVRSPTTPPHVSALYAYPDLIEDFDIARDTKSTEARELFQRMRRWEAHDRTIDQIDYAVRTLQRSPNSRRAVMSLWDPARDTDLAEAVCPCQFQVTLRPGGSGDLALNATLLVRSSDAWLGAPLDISGFIRLQTRIAERLGVRPGEYVHHVVSYHLYQHHLPALRLRLREALG